MCLSRRDFLFVSTAACAAATATGQAATDTMTTHVYKEVDGVPIHADVYPAATPGPRPVVMWIHGGALILGSRASVFKSVRAVCQENGYHLVSFDYRLGPEVKVPAILTDIEDGYAWIRETGPDLFGADPDRIVVAGTSAGGYLTLTTGYRVRPRPVALVSYWGYGDIGGDWYTKPSEHYVAEARPVSKADAEAAVNQRVITGTGGSSPEQPGRGSYYTYLRQQGLWTREMTGFDPESEAEKVRALCPRFNITADFPPTMLIHGTNDTDVPYDQSVLMANALKRDGVQCELVTVEGAGHGLSGVSPELVAEAHDRGKAFIRLHLGNA